MSWNNVIPASVINDIMDEIAKEPKQLHFDEDVFPPCYTIDPKSVCALNDAFTWVSSTGTGPYGTLASAVNHPAFESLRQHLGARGYISIENRWVNGDCVLKQFYLNEVLFDVGEKFLSASAMQHYLKRKKRDAD